MVIHKKPTAQILAACGLLLASGMFSKVLADQASTNTPAGVQLDIPADVPVKILNFTFDHSPAGMTAFHYDVQNASGQGLVAVEIRWQVQTGSLGSPSGNAVVNRDDRWLTGQIAAGTSDHFQVTNVPNTTRLAGQSGDAQPSVVQTSASLDPASRLVATVAYVELEDGSRLGTDVARVGEEVAKARRTQLAAAAKLLNAFGTGGNEALAHAVQQGSATTGQDPAAQELNARMLGLLQDQGLDAVVLELRRIAALTVPESRE